MTSRASLTSCQPCWTPSLRPLLVSSCLQDNPTAGSTSVQQVSTALLERGRLQLHCMQSGPKWFEGAGLAAGWRAGAHRTPSCTQRWLRWPDTPYASKVSTCGTNRHQPSTIALASAVTCTRSLLASCHMRSPCHKASCAAAAPLAGPRLLQASASAYHPARKTGWQQV